MGTYQGAIAVNQLVATLMSNYNVEQSECEEQVISFLDLLLEEDLIEIFLPMIA